MKYKANIGVFGGSGFYSFLDDVQELTIDTPYGAPSDKIAIAEIHNKKVAFLPRHGKDHRLPPHMINYRANLYAMKQLGVTRIIGPCAAGSLQPHVKPGDFVICNQFAHRTWGRRDTFYDGPSTTHIGGAEPYCPEMRELAIKSAKKMGISVHETGTVVVIQGPRFSTKAESQEFSSLGWEVINMTQYPEAILARELEICYTNISLITDYDAGLEGNPDVEAVSHEMVIKVFNENLDNLRKVLIDIIKEIPDERSCICSNALETARL
ncbi:MAG TPA: S-methyl-5'-thioadenosine phosphorylase [Thermoanaerobacterales bacterium]|nr:S-methyl-5'-thioadenosine phosphorylase [Thermoanaerobacterales bacterium]